LPQEQAGLAEENAKERKRMSAEPVLGAVGDGGADEGQESEEDEIEEPGEPDEFEPDLERTYDQLALRGEFYVGDVGPWQLFRRRHPRRRQLSSRRRSGSPMAWVRFRSRLRTSRRACAEKRALTGLTGS